MLSSKYAARVLEILKAKKEKTDAQAADLKRKRDEDNAERQAKLSAEREEREAKRRKVEEEKKKEAVCCMQLCLDAPFFNFRIQYCRIEMRNGCGFDAR